MRRFAPIRIASTRQTAVNRACHLVVIRHLLVVLSNQKLTVILSGAWRAFTPRAVEGPAVAFPRRAAAKLLVLTLLLSALPTFAAQQPDSPSPVVLDRAVAVVNKHVILASDLDDEIRLSILDPNTVSKVEITRQQALDQLIS